MQRSPSASPKYVLTLAVVAGLILLLGVMLRSRLPAAQESQPSETDIARLDRLTERRSLESRVKFFQDIADEVAPSIVWIPETGMSGIAWENRVVVTARSRQELSTAISIRSADADVRASDVVWSPRLSAASLHLPGSSVELRPALRSESLGRPGEWAVAVWRSGQGRLFASAQFLESVRVVCDGASTVEVLSTITLTPGMAGGGVFDVGGHLMGVILPCGSRYAVITPGSVDQMLQEAGSIEGRLLARFGLAFGAFSDSEMKYFKASSGVIVREVWAGQSAAKAGLMPGDIVIAIDKSEVTSPEVFQKELASSSSNLRTLSVRRGSRTSMFELAESDAAPSESAGLLWEIPQEGFRINSVTPGSQAANAGILSGDYVLRIGFAEPVSLAQLQRLLAPGNSSAVFVELQRGNRRWGTLLGPASF